MTQAIEAAAPGGPEVMRLVDRTIASPAPNEALVRVAFAGVNFIDAYHRSGAYAVPHPIRLGLEGSGTIEAIGADARASTGLRVGDRVAWHNVPGSYARHVVARALDLMRVPDALPLDHAACAMLQGLTAHYLARSTFPLAPGHTCLVHAAAGGTGLLLCQMASRAGARVLGTTSTEAKANLARRAGAAEVILYTREDFADAARRLTADEGVHVVYDSIGKDTFAKSLDALRRRGTLVLFGQASGPVPPFDAQILNQKGSLFLTRPKLGDYVATREEHLARSTELLRWIEAGDVRLTIGATFPLERAADAHRALEGRATTGKVLLDAG